MPRKSLAHKGISTAEKSSPVLASDSTGFVYDRTKPQGASSLQVFPTSRQDEEERRSRESVSESVSQLKLGG